MDIHSQQQLLVLFAVEALGGEATKREALDYLEAQGVLRLTPDLMVWLESRKEIKWRNKLAYGRQESVQNGLLSAETKDRWVITAEGRRALDKMAEEACSASIDLVWLSHRGLEAMADRAGIMNSTDTEEQLWRHVELLRQRVLPPPIGQPIPNKGLNSRGSYQRRPVVVAWVLQEADGKCELCAEGAPFTSKKGRPYLEVHHVRMLANGGSDGIRNAVALCPNCHRRLHIRGGAHVPRARYHAVPRNRRGAGRRTCIAI